MIVDTEYGDRTFEVGGNCGPSYVELRETRAGGDVVYAYMSRDGMRDLRDYLDGVLDDRKPVTAEPVAAEQGVARNSVAMFVDPHDRIRAYEAVKDRETYLDVEQTRKRVEWLLTGEVTG